MILNSIIAVIDNIFQVSLSPTEERPKPVLLFYPKLEDNGTDMMSQLVTALLSANSKFLDKKHDDLPIVFKVEEIALSIPEARSLIKAAATGGNSVMTIPAFASPVGTPSSSARDINLGKRAGSFESSNKKKK